MATGVLATALLLPLQADAKIEIAIPEVSEAIQTNVRAFLSLTRYAERDDVTAEVMSRLQRRIVSETRQALEPLGFYDPNVTYDVKQEGAVWKVTIHIEPGRPVRLSEVNINVTGAGAEDRAIRELLDQQEIKPGLRLNHGTYERVKGNLVRVAKNEGYLDAKLTRHDLVIDRFERRATVDLEADTGERYLFGDIDIAQDVITDEAMRRLLRMQPGDPYTLDTLLRTQYTLDDTQYFSVVDIESGDPDPVTRTVPITVTAEPSRKHRYAASVGYGTDTKARGKFTWDNRRVNEDGHKFKLELLGSSIVSDLTGRYVVPVMDIALEKLEFTGTLRDEELGDTQSKRAEVSAGLTQVQGRWQRVLKVALAEEETIEADNTSSTNFYIVPSIAYSTLPSYIVGGRRRPYSFSAELRGSPETLGSDASFLQLRLKGERIFDMSELWHLHLRSELGLSRIAATSDLPASQRFFAGGEGSVRGFALNELSPKDDQGRTVGGRNLVTGTVEVVRDLPRNFGVAAFYDIGNAFDDFSDPMLEYSAGLGVRYNIAVATFGVDVAQALSESGRSPRFHLYIATQF
ncbi:outer membrane protein assembly factor [Steroidobacter agaridevorans]|uniref:Outer membrane protein assembly factor n=1 Tax=Steroidobacter agaridevorans TaxID=2695856 RepID=A0A829Y584_9GAMM|nr:BamA/TamA family outer membrane protein [Steroidobacter agaridevorans]GFE78128.1 outer membrane protein assembly factor [Steroidobacter agaridevorans]GFE91187.1 outer membrane protein assembly factor [Steroidobacter agaridevorans]